MGLHKLREILHSKILKLRSIAGMVGTMRFDRLWKDSDERQRKEVTDYVEKGDRASLLQWIKNHPSLTLGEMSGKQLKNLAASLLVYGWSRMSKAELITAIKEAKHGFE